MLIRCVNRDFRDLADGVMRRVGDEWEADASRLAEINRAGYGVMAEEVAAEPATEAAEEPEAVPLSRMTKAELLDKAEAMGVEVPYGATKAAIIDLIGE